MKPELEHSSLARKLIHKMSRKMNRSLNHSRSCT